MTQTQDWFPGADFPDREDWLKFRAPRVSSKARLIHDSASGPLVLGINAAKREHERAHAIVFPEVKNHAKHGARRHLIQQRHAYYARRAEA